MLCYWSAALVSAQFQSVRLCVFLDLYVTLSVTPPVSHPSARLFLSTHWLSIIHSTVIRHPIQRKNNIAALLFANDQLFHTGVDWMRQNAVYMGGSADFSTPHASGDLPLWVSPTPVTKMWGEIDRSGARDKKQRVHPWQDRVDTGVGLPLVLYFKRW